MMKLRELVRQIRTTMHWTQEKTAEVLDLGDKQSVQRLENSGDYLEKQFVKDVKIISFAQEIGILESARELLPPTAEEVIRDVERNGKKACQIEPSKALRSQKEGSRHIRPSKGAR